MTNPVLPRSLLFAAALFAAGFGAPAEAGAQLSLGPVAERWLTLPAPLERTPGALPEGTDEPDVLLAQADCSSAAAQAAAETGGQVLSVSSSEQGGRTVCVVTVLVPGQDGGRPRKRTITIPQ